MNRKEEESLEIQWRAWAHGSSNFPKKRRNLGLFEYCYHISIIVEEHFKMDSTTKFCDQKSLTAIFNEKKSMSLEVNSNETIHLDILPTMLLDFVAIPWIGNFEGFPARNIPAIQLAEELISRKITVLLHIACRNLNKVSAMNILMYIRHIGVRNILALEGESKFVAEKDLSEMDFPYTCHFVEFIKENFENFFTIGVTGYPQKHPRSCDMNQELEFLRLKVSKGADFILTQGCLDKRVLSDFQKMCKNFNISIPIVAGTFLLRSTNQLNTLKKCNISVESELFRFRDEMSETFESFFRNLFREIGEMVLDENVEDFAGLHIFSFNDTNYISEVMDEFTYFARCFNKVTSK